MTIGETRQRYVLRGVIYGGENHFTSRIVRPNGDMWYHDGIETGHKTVNEGSMHSMQADYLNTCDKGGVRRTAIGVIYAIGV
ncbi:hypothetical protein C8R44DRAFT_632100 [Mycena epipterygia]|nr:hypothetical protein C8R44DRAFT_632100 [Mycena epipterygia]